VDYKHLSEFKANFLLLKFYYKNIREGKFLKASSYLNGKKSKVTGTLHFLGGFDSFDLVDVQVDMINGMFHKTA
jgi:hypothetical protein